MEEFVALENIRRFKEQLGTCTDVRRRQTIEGLLEDEQLKLRALQRETNSNLVD